MAQAPPRNPASSPAEAPPSAPVSWQLIRDVMERRIRARACAPGANIPNEADLAAAGFVERRRKAGTRVLESPRRRATLEIPLIRDEVEAAGQRYGYLLLSRRVGPAGAALAARRRRPCW